MRRRRKVGHVGQIVGRDARGRWLVHSGNDGRAIRTRPRSLKGALLSNDVLIYSQDTLEALAEALMCEPADLLMRDPTSPDPIWSVWDRVPATKRNDALRVLAAFAEGPKKTGT